jgi:hypothetical protein
MLHVVNWLKLQDSPAYTCFLGRAGTFVSSLAGASVSFVCLGIVCYSQPMDIGSTGCMRVGNGQRATQCMHAGRFLYACAEVHAASHAMTAGTHPLSVHVYCVCMPCTVWKADELRTNAYTARRLWRLTRARCHSCYTWKAQAGV